MAYVFAGGTDRIAYGNTSVPRLPGASKAMLSFWCWPNAIQGDQWGQFVFYGNDGESSGLGAMQYGTDVHRLFVCARNSDVTPHAISEPFILTQDAWNHVLVVFDGTQSGNDRLKAWVNGSAATLSYGGTPPPTLGSDAIQTVNVGADPTGAFNLAGRVAEVALWAGVAISDAGFVNLLAKGYSPAHFPNGLVVYLPLIRGANDVCGNAGTATVTGATVTSHPRVIYPSRVRMGRHVDAGGGGSPQTLTPDSGIASWATPAPTIQASRMISTPAAEASWTAPAPTIVAQVTIPAPVASVAWIVPAASIAGSQILTPSEASSTWTALVPLVGRSIPAPPASSGWVVPDPSIVTALTISLNPAIASWMALPADLVGGETQEQPELIHIFGRKQRVQKK